MKLDDILITLEQAKKLQELGFKKESLFNWIRFGNVPKGQSGQWERRMGQTRFETQYPAYTAEELGEILPESISRERDGVVYTYWLKMQKSSERFEVWYYDDIHGDELVEDAPKRAEGEYVDFILGPTLAQAMGDMLIYLLENNLVPKDIKDA